MALPYRPIVYEKWGKDIPSGPYSEVSSKPCRYYNTGRQCYNAYCPFVHDSTLRNEAIDRQRFADQKAFNDKALASARQRLQQDYNDCKLDYNASIQAQSVTAVGPTINKNDPTITNSRLKLQAFYDNAKATTKTIHTPVQASNDDSNIEKAESVVKDIDTIQSSNPEIKMEKDQPILKEMDKVLSPQNDPTNEKDANGSLKQQCKDFVKRQCKSKDQCLRFHDYEARKKHRKEKRATKKTSKDAGDISENKADNPAATTERKQGPFSATIEQDSKCQTKNPQEIRAIKKLFIPNHKQDNAAKFSAAPRPKQKVQPQPRQSKALVTYSEVTSKSMVPVPAPETPPTMAVVKVETPEAGIYVAAPFWDLPYYEAWASKNLAPATAAKYLAYRGRIPIKLFAHIPKASLTEGPTTFHCFQYLPFELRAQIYEMALESEPYKCRIIRQWENEKGEFCGKGRIQKQQRFTPKTRAPSLLHVNKESSQHARKKYQLTFATREFRYQTWFSFKSDNLFINTSSSAEMSLCMKLLDERDLVRILYLTLALRDFVQNKNVIFAWNLSRFRSLRRLTLLVGDSVEDSKWSRDKKLRGKVQLVIDYGWITRCKKERIPQIPPPVVDIKAIPAMRAKYFGIDGIKWGMGGTLEREMLGS